MSLGEGAKTPSQAREPIDENALKAACLSILQEPSSFGPMTKR